MAITNWFEPSVYGQARNSCQRAIYKKEESWQNLDVAIPKGCGVRAMEHGKVEKYQVLARKV